MVVGLLKEFRGDYDIEIIFNLYDEKTAEVYKQYI